MRLYRRTAKPGQPQNLVWQYEFEYKGIPVRKSTYRTNRKEADTYARAEHAKYKNRVDGITPAEAEDVPAVTLQALADRYIKWAQVDHPATAGSDETRLARFVEIVKPETFIHTIRASHIDAWRVTRAGDKTPKGGFVLPSTINRELTVIRGLFRQAIKWDCIKTHPCNENEEKRIEDFDTDATPVRILTAEEIERAYQLPEPFNLFCEFTFCTLARLKEVRTLRNEHVSIDVLPNGHKVATLQKRVKGGHWRRVAIPVALAQRLRAYVTDASQEYIFPEFATSNAVSARFAKLFKAAGLRCSHHAFRHSGITRMLEAGINPRAIQEHAGWSNLKQLQRYGRVLDQEFSRAVDVGGDFLKQARAERDAARREALTILNGGKKDGGK